MIIPLQDHLFSISEDVAYLNTAYMSPLMHSVVDAMALGSSYKIEPWTYTPDQFFSLPEEARSLAGQIFGCSAENIAIVPSASYGIQTAANIYP